MKELFSERQLREGMPALTRLLSKCQNITYFYIKKQKYFKTYPELNSIIVGLIAKLCPNLRSINNSSLGLCHNSAKTFIESIEYKLESICLLWSTQNFETINGKRVPNLRRLKIINDFSQIDESFLSSLSITGLTHLYLFTSDNIIEDNFLKTIIRSNQRLNYLKIGYKSKDKPMISTDFLTDLSTLTQLKSLTICFPFNLKSKTISEKFKTIGEKCHKLETFNFDDIHCERHYGQTILPVIEYYQIWSLWNSYHWKRW